MNNHGQVFVTSILVLLFSSAVFSFQKPEIFDIVTYTPPVGWQKEVSGSFIQFGAENKNGGICLITLFKSIPTDSDSRTNFKAAWQTLVKEMVIPDGEPNMQAPAGEKGWAAETGLATYDNDGRKGVIMLLTMTGGNKMVNVIVLTNTDAFQPEIDGFFGSISLPEVKTQTPHDPVNPPTDSSSRLIGKWNRSGSVSPVYADPVSMGNAGYTKNRYEFSPNGTYLFTERTFRMSYQYILIVRESGHYAVSGNQLTIRPNKSVIESYSKENNGDILGRLVKSQNRESESITYTFTFHYFSGIREWNLVLQADHPTNRDGAFSNNTTFPNAWYYDQKFIDNDLTSKTAK